MNSAISTIAGTQQKALAIDRDPLSYGTVAEIGAVQEVGVCSFTWAVPRAKNKRLIMLRKTIILVVLLSLIAGTVMAQEPEVTPLMSKDLKDFPGKEGLMITVEYPPGGSDPIHRHNAHAFLYVLEGSVVMQVRGGKQVTLTPGQTFYEGPNDVHVVGRNASKTKPAKFLVFLVKDKGAPVLLPVK
jgi:quercetin dioxygenase-like cupin family protein